MKNILTVLMLGISLVVVAQTNHQKEFLVTTQTTLHLDFQFADEILLELWDKDLVRVEVVVLINDGEDDELFQLKSEVSKELITVEMDKEKWETFMKESKKKCWNSEINYRVYYPSTLEIRAETISGNYSLLYSGKSSSLKTISGDIDLTVGPEKDLDFRVKTISGEVYSNLEIVYPDGKEGLRQVVGINVTGRVGSGGPFVNMETISGNVYLRKG